MNHQASDYETQCQACRVETQPARALTSEHRGCSNVRANDHVSEEQPSADQRLFRRARRAAHDVGIGRVEAQSRRGQSIGNEIDPKKLHWDQSFGHAE